MKNLSILSLFLLGLTFVPSQLVESKPVENHSNISHLKQYLEDIGPTKTIKEGEFKSGEHETKGIVRLVQAESGRYYLEFDNSFATDKGPDLFVVLHRDDDVLASSSSPNYPLEKEDYYMVSPLLEIKGKQRYILPGNFDFSDYPSIAIWCRQFNATFGAAYLEPISR